MYRHFLKYICEQEARHNYGLTLTEIKQTARHMFSRESSSYGWERYM